jgi:hypothetical protein
MTKIQIDNTLRDMTPEEENELQSRIAKREEKKLNRIRGLRLVKLQATDYMANSDYTMPENIKTWRQSLRDIPQTYTTEAEYDLLLAKEKDKTKSNYGNLTHEIWSKP